MVGFMQNKSRFSATKKSRPPGRPLRLMAPHARDSATRLPRRRLMAKTRVVEGSTGWCRTRSNLNVTRHSPDVT